MPLPPDFASEAMYDESAWFVTDVTFDDDAGAVVATCDTTKLGPLVRAQHVWPNHPKHFPGAVAIQITGTLGQLWATYVRGLRATEGWVGFGTHLHQAKFRKLGEIGPPVRCVGTLISEREVWGTVFTRFSFRFTQQGDEIFRSEQTAAWVRSDHQGPRPEFPVE